MDKNFRLLSPYGKALALGSGSMQYVNGDGTLVGLCLIGETRGVKCVFNSYTRVEAGKDPKLLGLLLCDAMISDYAFRQALSYALSQYRLRKGRPLRGDG